MRCLFRIMKYVGNMLLFNYYLRCVRFWIIRLRFADDFMFFSKGDCQSVFFLLRGSEIFFLISGFSVNKGKSVIYYDNVKENIK